MVKIELEYQIRSSVSVLYQSISSPSGLAGWFADNVNIKKDIYTFIWDGGEEDAKLLAKSRDEFIRFHWMDHEDEDTYFEIRIDIDPLTKVPALLVTDFAEEGDEEDALNLWTKQLDDLAQLLGVRTS
jgi:uncharacterized protein YndB with AHSA1/START domain